LASVVGVATAASSAQGEPVPDRSRLRRFLEVTGFWLVYIGIGEAVGIDSSIGDVETYLLIGFGLTVLFQLLVARRDIKELWVRTAPAVVLSRFLIVLALALAVYPVVMLVKSIVDSEPASVPIALIVITAGAAPAAYALGLFREETWRYLGLCCLLVLSYLVASSLIFDGEKVFTHPLEAHPDQDLEVFILSLLQYIPTVFVFEEVVFRGCLDSHLHRPGERRGGWTAAYISLLWCMWHAPMFGWDEFPNLIIGMFPVGIVLSIYWRKAGNLGVSGGAHALNDSVRNALWGVP
jgi:membrane protease YdiL (CAAX protease family)